MKLQMAGWLSTPVSRSCCACWFDERWHRCRDHSPEELIIDGIVSEAEFRIIDKFSQAFRAAYPKGTRELEQDLRKLQNDPTWLKVVQAAKDARSQLRALDPTADVG